MNNKRIIGLVVLVIGLIAIVLSFYIKHMVNVRVGNVKAKTESVSNNPFVGMGGKQAKSAAGKVTDRVDRMADDKAAAYYTLANWILIGGLVFAVGGGATTYIFRGKR